MRSFVLILVVSSLVLSAQTLCANENPSQEPSKNREASPALRVQQERNSDKEQAQTQSRPLPPAIPATDAVVSEPKTQDNKHDPDNQTPWWRDVNAPGWAQVFVAGIGLFMIWRTLKAVEVQAEANRLTAKALVQAERAYVFAKVELPATIVTSIDGIAITLAKTLFVNHGKTPAIINYMSGAQYITDETPQQLLTALHVHPEIPDGLVIASELAYQHSIGLRITNAQMGEIENRTKKLYCAGLIKYKDILGNQRETGFCWEYLPFLDEPRFTFCEKSKLNYCT